MRRSSAPVCRALCIFTVGLACAVLPALRLSAASFDWRYYSGNWNSSVKNQFGGTCWNFAACGTFEAKYRLTRNDSTYDVNVSEQHVNWETRPDMGSTDGGWAYKVLNYFITHGVVSEAECPYQSSSPNVGIEPYWPLDEGWENRVYKTTSYLKQFTKNTDTMKTYLKTCGPLAVGIWASHDLYGSVADLKANYRAPSNAKLDHEVSLVGYYDDPDVPTGGYWVVKNSWGTGEGQSGYDYIPYGNIEIHNDVSAITGPAFYTGSLASVTWKGGTAAWVKNGTNWTNNADSKTYTWQNYETSATFTGVGRTVPLSGTVIAHGMTISAGATGYSFTGGALTLTGGGITANESVAISSPITVGGPQTWVVPATKSLSVGVVHTIISPLTIQAAGNVTIAGSIDGGGVANAAGAPPGTITKTGSGTLYLTGNATYSTPLALTAGKLDFAQPVGVSANVTGVISGGSAATVVKSGSGTVRFTGNNTYTGTTEVNAGLLAVNGVQKSSLIVVNDSGILGGTGTIGNARVAAGGHLDPGEGIGTLSISNYLTLNLGARLDFDLDSPVNSDRIYMPNATLSLAGQNFSDFTFDTFDDFGLGTYLLIDARTIVGSLGSNIVGWIGDKSAKLSLSNGDLLLTVVPEPSTLISLLAGLLTLGAFARRRRK